MKFKSEEQRKAVMAKLNPPKSIEEARKRSSQTEKQHQEMIDRRKENRQLKRDRFKGGRRYFTEKDIRTELDPTGLPKKLPRGKQLERLGYQPLKGTITGKSKYHVLRNQRQKGKDAQFVYLGSGRWRTYLKDKAPKEYDTRERDQWGIIKGQPDPKKDISQPNFALFSEKGGWDDDPNPYQFDFKPISEKEARKKIDQKTDEVFFKYDSETKDGTHLRKRRKEDD